MSSYSTDDLHSALALPMGIEEFARLHRLKLTKTKEGPVIRGEWGRIFQGEGNHLFVYSKPPVRVGWPSVSVGASASGLKIVRDEGIWGILSFDSEQSAQSVRAVQIVRAKAG